MLSMSCSSKLRYLLVVYSSKLRIKKTYSYGRTWLKQYILWDQKENKSLWIWKIFAAQVQLTTSRFNIVDSVAIHLQHLWGIWFLLFVAADGECILADLNKNKVTFLPFLPHRFPHGIHITEILYIHPCCDGLRLRLIFFLPTVLHIHRFVHPHCYFYLEILILRSFRDIGFVPFRNLNKNVDFYLKCVGSIQNIRIKIQWLLMICSIEVLKIRYTQQSPRKVYC